MKIYNNPTIEIRSFISESVITASPLPAPNSGLEEWKTTTKGTVVEKDINMMKVMQYTF